MAVGSRSAAVRKAWATRKAGMASHGRAPIRTGVSIRAGVSVSAIGKRIEAKLAPRGRGAEAVAARLSRRFSQHANAAYTVQLVVNRRHRRAGGGR